MSRKTTLSTGFAVATIALFALTGCGSSESGTTTDPAPVSSPAAESPAAESPAAEAPAGDQSKADACQILQTELTDLNTEVNGASGELSSAVQSGDTSGARDMFTKIGDRIDEISGMITNPDVSEAYASYSAAWDEFEKTFVKISDAVDAKDNTALQAAANDLTDGISGFTDAAKEISTACS
ncbi:hypothetical protein ACIQLK_02520 [Microbacterium sp. NPDC091382]|uniref:hypothetical protein n=1 Tax=Microbacterium sp. NPDC091382 TaxID=3364210 RepID=UPI00382FC024